MHYDKTDLCFARQIPAGSAYTDLKGWEEWMTFSFLGYIFTLTLFYRDAFQRSCKQSTGVLG